MVVAAKEPVAEGVVALTLRAADGSALPPWEPGAHIDLVLAPDLVRQYSLCGDPADRDSWRVAVLREPVGRGGSAHVHDRLAVGDRLTVRGPRNHFPLAPATRYLFLAGGIGITPLLPMIAAARAAGAEWRLAYGGRSRATMAFLDDLALPQVDVQVGLLDLDALLAEPEPGTLVYACGPEPMLDAVEGRCADWPPGALRVERFKAAPGTGEATEFEVELAVSGRTVKVPADRSVLEAVEEAGLSPLSSCREGTCGTCETGVLGGALDHRDTVLSEAERKEGDVMMICVSRARSARLVLEL
jgi:ferredoxin-NADP reductase